MNRRSFLRTGALAAAAAPAIWTRRASALPPSDTVRLAILGPGSRGKNLMQHFLRSEGVAFTSACDIYAPRFGEAERVAGTSLATFDDYRALLDHASDYDAVIMATPLGWHDEHVVACLDAGLHVYAEKSLALTPEGCDAIRDRALESDRVVQIGLQYRYAGWYSEAVRRIREGDIGRVTHIYAYWHRNYNWRRPVPSPDLEQLINWRLYRELSGGLLAELGSHHIETANWIFGEAPSRVMGTGDITFYHDGRETFDNLQAIYEYSGGRRLLFSSVIGNRKTGFQIIVYGTSGTIELTLQDAHIFHERATEQSAVPDDLLNDPRYTSPTLATDGDMPFRGSGRPIETPEDLQGDPTTRATAAFVDCIRTGERPDADIHVGWACGTAVAHGIQAIRSGMPVEIAHAAVGQN